MTDIKILKAMRSTRDLLWVLVIVELVKFAYWIVWIGG